jgi:hypothetical protein
MWLYNVCGHQQQKSLYFHVWVLKSLQIITQEEFRICHDVHLGPCYEMPVCLSVCLLQLEPTSLVFGWHFCRYVINCRGWNTHDDLERFKENLFMTHLKVQY